MIYTCKECKEDNLLSDEMYWQYGRPYICKKCFNARQTKYRKNGGIRHSRNKSFKYKYGITLQQYEEMLIKQNNECAICERQFDEKIRPDVDHHHESKKVRGILCHACNLALGYLKEDEKVIQNMLDYLDRTTWSITGEKDVATVQ